MRRWLLLCLVSALLAGTSIAQAVPAPRIEERVIALADGTQIRVRRAGHPTGAPALVFIPGWTMPAFLWDPQLKTFSSDRLAIAVDPRSQGDSSKTELGNTPEQRAKDLHEILTQLHIPRYVLIGWSQGAQDVAAYIQQFGTDSVAGVAFVDSPVAAGPAGIGENEQESEQFFGRIALYVNHPAEYCEGMVRFIFKKPPPDLDMKAVIAHCRQTPVPTGLTMLIMDMYAVDRRGVLAKIDRPTLVIASADSPLLKAQEQMAKTIHGAQFVAVPGAGHGVFVDDPRTFNAALERLLQSLPSK